jgi:thymidylate synthase (FAD)
MPKIVSPSFTIESEIDGKKILREIERFARNCYKSEGKITDDSAEPFIRRLMNIRPIPHLGIFDHHVVSVRLVIDRGISHEVVRHRIAAYLQESSRYCDYGKVGEIQVIGITQHLTNPKSFAVWWQAMVDAERAYNTLRELGERPEIARSVLPNSLKTEIIVTMNLTSWRNFFKKRTDTKAHPQMREIAVPLLAEFQRLIPAVFEDIV